MPRKKIQRFKELEKLSNVAQLSQTDAKQKLQNFLNNSKPTLELACGKGEYTIALAERFPDMKFIGIDVQGERIWYGAKQALDKKLDNVFFLRVQIEDLQKYFTDNSIAEIWITFPDPFPRKKQIKKRLTSPRFLQIYKHLLQAKGLVNLKTDDESLFDYSVEMAEAIGANIITHIKDIYNQRVSLHLLDIQTYYEKIHLEKGATINYLKFNFN
ncbi:tRNA (guanosine(46)-N7)-methyltransferase TrmB [Candidatus Parcubacteria bacterium]|jgi:tRNA (guanine-N7-)-methyltransferase|nr:tRNA (guanosine(46)-N7)-methyltransferase TrmB [Candidatus Parcubacteria bacterium]